MLSKVSVDEVHVFMHYFQSTSSGPRWGTCMLHPLVCPPLKKFCGRPWRDLNQFEVTYYTSYDRERFAQTGKRTWCDL